MTEKPPSVDELAEFKAWKAERDERKRRDGAYCLTPEGREEVRSIFGNDPDSWVWALFTRVEELEAALASQDMEQRAGWMPIETAPKDGTTIILGYEGSYSEEGHWMSDPSRNHWRETGWFASDADVLCEHPSRPSHWQPMPPAPPLPAPPIEALEGGKTDLGASGPVHQDTSSTPASESELRNLVAALRKLGEPVYAIGGELPLGSDQLIALDAANAIERLSSKAGWSQA